MNRSLFLIFLKDRKNERFWGGDPENLEQALAKQSAGLATEYYELATKASKHFDYAFMLWAQGWETEEIPYLDLKGEGNNGRT